MASPVPTAVATSVAPSRAAPSPAHATVRFEPSGVEVCVARGTSLLEAARQAGLPVASSCDRNVACGRCGMHVIASARGMRRESDRERAVKSRNRVEADVRLSCVFPVDGDLTVTTSYW